MENGDLFVTWMAAGKNDDWFASRMTSKNLNIFIYIYILLVGNCYVLLLNEINLEMFYGVWKMQFSSYNPTLRTIPIIVSKTNPPKS